MKKHFYFPSTDRRTKIHAIQWTNENVTPKGVVQLIHGMVEHIERYDEFANFLADQGYIVVGHDHLGHGRSVVSEEDYGFFDENQPALVLLQDIHRLRIGTSRKYPGLPYIMLGHSMGSYLLRRYLSSHGEGLDGAIIVGTGQEADAATTAGLAFLKFEAKKHGWRYRSETAAKMTFGAPYRKFDLTGQDPHLEFIIHNHPKRSLIFLVDVQHTIIPPMLSFWSDNKHHAPGKLSHISHPLFPSSTQPRTQSDRSRS